RRLQPFNRLGLSLTPQSERLVMNGQKVLCPGRIGHCYCLFRCAMRTDPRPVSANRHHGQLEGPLRSERTKRVAHRRVTPEKKTPALPAQNIAVVPSIGIPPNSRTPVLDLEGLDLNVAFLALD